MINQIKICDPAVGSGHFLVSALNEIIAIKNELGILVDKDGLQLKTDVEVVNDELMITDEDGIPFSYNPNNKESQRTQETLFHEKQTIIENCLFGVDINPNSVKICRLRLWIELLKNAYYRVPEGAVKTTPPYGHPSSGGELETLPNIDINIKCGNSLISRFGLDTDLKKALKQSKWNIESYKLAVATYRNAESKEQKRQMERLIGDIKSNFRSEIGTNDPKKLKLEKLKGELFNYTQQVGLFERSKKEQTEWNKKVNVLGADINTLDTEIEEIKSNKIYENAFEWRFEFPDVLNDNGDFVGFDVVIGNPPYIGLQNNKVESESLSKLGYETFDKSGDLYVLFCERGNQILKEDGDLSFIIPNKWMSAGYGKNLRKYLVSKTNPTKIIDFEKVFVFNEAVVFVCILGFIKQPFANNLKAVKIIDNLQMLDFENQFNNRSIEIQKFDDGGLQIASDEINAISDKIERIGVALKDWENIEFFRGVTTGYNEAFHIDFDTRNEIIKNDPFSNEIIKPLLRGKDIKRFIYTDPNLYIIFSNKGIDIDNYYGAKSHLAKFQEELTPKTNFNIVKGRKPGNYKWYEIQDNTAYFKEFENEKIIWMEISDKGNFTLDTNKMFLTNSAYFISGKNLKYLLAILNSKLCDFYFFQKTALIAGGRKRYTKQYVEQNPIPVISKENQQPFIDKVNEILSLKSQDPKADTQNLEQEIDVMVYELYGLTAEEITIVENS